MITSDIKDCINSLNINKSTRSDLPKTKFLKMSINVISPIITSIFNKCITEGVFPNSLKIAEVTPIYKSGTKSDINNYRPISLLSPFSKLFEKHLYKCLSDFFVKNNVLYNKQFGFRNQCSTELAVIDIVNELSSNLDKNLITCGVFLDLAKAFNTVNHSILLKKLEKYGIRGLTLSLFESYLSSRMQVTKINSHVSSMIHVDSGVPQGSCLGPLLFLIYVNDMPLSTQLKTRLFADDACLTFADKDPNKLEVNINNELSRVKAWLRANKLFLNYNKTNYLIFTKRKKKLKFNIIMNNYTLEEKNSTKYLGILIDNKLTWQAHIDSLKAKLSQSCYALYMLKSYANIEAMKHVYYGLIYSKIEYCISSWGGCCVSRLSPIIKLQKKAIRLICNKPYIEPTHNLFIKMKMLKLVDIFKLKICTLVQHVKNNNIVGDLLIRPLSHTHKHFTRLQKRNNFYIPSSNTNLGKTSFNYLAPKMWQEVPEHIKNINSNRFKFQLKKYFIKLYDND